MKWGLLPPQWPLLGLLKRNPELVESLEVLEGTMREPWSPAEKLGHVRVGKYVLQRPFLVTVECSAIVPDMLQAILPVGNPAMQ